MLCRVFEIARFAAPDHFNRRSRRVGRFNEFNLNSRKIGGEQSLAGYSD